VGTTILVAVLLLAVVAAVVVAMRRSREDVPLKPATIHEGKSADPYAAAKQWAAANVPGPAMVSEVGATGSMVPFLTGGEWLVMVNDFPAVGIGRVVAYTTVGGTAPAIGSRIVHRIASANDAGAWLPMGDAVGMPLEEWNPITPANYLGTVVAVFRK